MDIICSKAQTKADVEFCKEALLAFRKNLDPGTVVEQVFRMISEEGYQLLFVANSDNTRAVAFVGYRVMNLLRTGPMIYIDDLFTASGFRGKGYAGTLLDHVANYAAGQLIKTVHLDSGYDLHTAHRLYLNKGFALACNHFAKNINIVPTQ